MVTVEKREQISPDDLANLLNKKVEDSKKEKEEELFKKAYSYVKIISNAIAEVPNSYIGNKFGYSLDTNKISLEGLEGIDVYSARGFVYEDSVKVNLDFGTHAFSIRSYDFDVIIRQLDKYNISITPVINKNEFCQSIDISYEPKKKKELESVDATVLDDISRDVEDEQPIEYSSSTNSVEGIDEEMGLLRNYDAGRRSL